MNIKSHQNENMNPFVVTQDPDNMIKSYIIKFIISNFLGALRPAGMCNGGITTR